MKQSYLLLLALAFFVALSLKWESLLIAGLVAAVVSLAFASIVLAAKAAKKNL